jgi:hypothetical protein
MGNSLIDFFDRVISVKLIKSDGTYLNIKCPDTGPKPNITLSGSFAGNVIYDATLKIMNLYTPSALSTIDGSTYKFVEIQCGYAKRAMTVISGQIFTAYQEKPSPDGAVVFQFILGWFEKWLLTPIALNIPTGTKIIDALDQALTVVNTGAPATEIVTLTSYIDPTDTLNTPIDCSTSMSDFAYTLGRNEGLVIMPDGKNKLVVKYSGLSQSPRDPVIELLYYNDVRKTGAGYTITAPFDPAVRPGCFIKVEPKYFVRDLGAMFVTFGYTFYVTTESFSFSTVDNENKMILGTVASKIVRNT